MFTCRSRWHRLEAIAQIQAHTPTRTAAAPAPVPWGRANTQRCGADPCSDVLSLFSVLSKGGKRTWGVGCPWSCLPWFPGALQLGQRLVCTAGPRHAGRSPS